VHPGTMSRHFVPNGAIRSVATDQDIRFNFLDGMAVNDESCTRLLGVGSDALVTKEEPRSAAISFV